MATLYEDKKKTLADREEERQKVYREFDTDKEKLSKDLRYILRDLHIDCISASFNKLISEQVKDIKIQTDLQVHRQKIVACFVNTVEQISQAIELANYRIPNNLHNIKDALENFSRKLDPFDIFSLDIACSNFHQEILPESSSSCIYSKEELEEKYQEGFEKGYEKAQKALKQNIESARYRLKELDL